MYISVLLFFVSVAAKDEDGASCCSSTEALSPLSSSFYHRDHFQLLAQGKNNMN